MHTLFCGFGILIFLSILFGERKFCKVKVTWNYLPDFIAACAAARRAIGTRNGEHGGDPVSVEFCHKIGLDYVSCSPFRVPIARLAAAQAAIKSGK